MFHIQTTWHEVHSVRKHIHLDNESAKQTLNESYIPVSVVNNALVHVPFYISSSAVIFAVC